MIEAIGFGFLLMLGAMLAYFLVIFVLALIAAAING